MSFFNRAAASTVVIAGAAFAGCAGEGGGMENFFTTGSLGSQSAAQDAKIDPACVSLSTRIEALRKEGIAEKIEKAAAKKYKMTQSDLTKADQLTKANADFQVRCAPIMPKSASAEPEPMPAPAPAAAPKSKSATKSASAAAQ